MEKRKIIEIKDVLPSSPDMEVVGVFNGGCTTFKNQTILLLRVAERPVFQDENKVFVCIHNCKTNSNDIKQIEKNDNSYDFSDPRVIKGKEGNFITTISHLRLAKSSDGINFEVDEKPCIKSETCYESYGIEDPRITEENGVYYITYVAVSDMGINTCLITTTNFENFERKGIIFHSDNKDVVFFPDKISGMYYALHRPSTSEFGKLDIWMANSSDLIHWGGHRVIMRSRDNFFDDYRIGAGCPPFLTKKGYVEIYHAGDENNHYYLGSCLFDKDNPEKIIARCKKPLLVPTEDYEKSGFFEWVVFTCGAVLKGNDVYLYYGAGDCCMALAIIPLEEIFENLGVKN